MEGKNQSVSRKFFLWEIAIAKISGVIAVLLSLVLFLFGNFFTKSSTSDPVTILGTFKYALSSFVGLFVVFSVINIISSLIALIRLRLKS